MQQLTHLATLALAFVILGILNLVQADPNPAPGSFIPSSFRYNDVTTPTTTSMASTGGNALPSSLAYNGVTTPTTSATGLSIVGALSGTATAPSMMPSVTSLLTASGSDSGVSSMSMTATGSIARATMGSSSGAAVVASPLGAQVALLTVLMSALGVFGGAIW